MLAVAVVVLALAVAACGGSSGNSTTTAAHKHRKTASKKRSTTSTTATTTSTSSATATQPATTTAPATQTTPPATATQTTGGGAPISPTHTQPQQTTPSHSCTAGPDCNPSGTPNAPGSSSPVNGKCPAGSTYLPPQDNGPALCVPSGTVTNDGRSGAASLGAADTTPSQ